MIRHGLGARRGGVMLVKNQPLSGVMLVKTGGVMILKNHGLQWGHVAEKSQHPPRLVGPGGRLVRP